jgi:histidinol-phosphate aminotransferase
VKARFRDNIERMSGYTPGEQPQGGHLIKLNTNENPYPPSPRVLEAVRREAAESLRLYPDPLSAALRAKAAEVYGFSAGQVLAGNGSDDLLTMLVRAFVPEGGLVATTRPTYMLYRTLAQIQGARAAEIPYGEGYALPSDDIVRAKADIVFVANPNSPTGTFTEPKALDGLAGRLDCPLVIDEAYVDFSRTNALHLARKRGNVVVLRTLSKSFSLAGMRLGLAFASDSVIRGLLKVKDSYNLDRVAQAAGIAALGDLPWMLRNAERIRATRRALAGGLRALGFDVPDSEANFVLATKLKPKALRLKEELQKRGILVRYFDEPGLRDSLRITVGTDEETDALLRELKGILGKKG